MTTIRNSLATLTLFAVSLCAINSAQAAMIRLRESATAAGPVVRLGDIADVVDSDPAIAARLSAVQLAPAPMPGNPLRIDFGMLRARLAAHGVNLASLEFTGSSVVSVTAAQSAGAINELTGPVRDTRAARAQALVAEAIGKYLSQRDPRLANLSVTVELAPSDITAILAGRAAGYHVQGGQTPWLGRQEFSLRFFDVQDIEHEVRVAATVAERPLILAAKYTIPAGQVLEAGDLEWQPGEVGATSLVRLEDVVGRETARRINKGEPLRRESIRAVPLVRSNDIVSVYKRIGGIVVERHMRARSEGALGERVTLVTLNGRETIFAQVTGYHEAEVIDAATPIANQGGESGGVRVVNHETEAPVRQGGK